MKNPFKKKKKKKGNSAQDVMVAEMSAFAAAASVPKGPPVDKHPPMTPEQFKAGMKDKNSTLHFTPEGAQFKTLGDYVASNARRDITKITLEFFEGLGRMVIAARKRGQKIHPITDLMPDYVANMLDIAIANKDFMGGFNGTETSVITKELFGEESMNYITAFKRIFNCFKDDLVVTPEEPPATNGTNMKEPDAPKDVAPTTETPPAATEEVIGSVTTTDVETTPIVNTDAKFKQLDIVRLLPELPSGQRYAEIVSAFLEEGKPKYKIKIYHTKLELIGSIGESEWPESDMELVPDSDLAKVRAIIEENKEAKAKFS